MEKCIPIRAAGSAANPLTEASLPKTGDNRTPNQDEETKQLLSSLPFQSETLPEPRTRGRKQLPKPWTSHKELLHQGSLRIFVSGTGVNSRRPIDVLAMGHCRNLQDTACKLNEDHEATLSQYNGYCFAATQVLQ